MDRRLVALLALATGVAVANLYYVQPLLGTIADAFGTSEGAAGTLVTFGQVGYVLGLALLVPAGDLLERRGLISALFAVCGLCALACAAAPSFAVLAAAILALGVTAVAAQVLVPLASSLAPEAERGAVVGTVMSGLLIGILAARTVSGLLAELGGWRVVYVVTAVLMLLFALVLRRALPHAPAPAAGRGYVPTLRSVLDLVREEGVLRERMALGATQMAGFSVLWTSLTFLLEGPHYGYSDGVIGLFGLAGVAGALAAPYAGRLADRGLGHLAILGFLAVVVLSWLPLVLGATSLPLLLLGIVLLDFGVQGAQISNQSAVYALRPEARSRLTTAYITAYFLGGVVGSLVSSLAWSAGGWDLVCALGAAIAVLGVALRLAIARYRAVAAANSGGAIAR